MGDTGNPIRLERSTFRTSRVLDFTSERELTAQIGHPPAEWPLVIVKELVDNALDACEDAGIAPEVAVRVGENGIIVSDNGPGLPAKVVEDVLDFSIRVSSREEVLISDAANGDDALVAIGILFRASDRPLADLVRESESGLLTAPVGFVVDRAELAAFRSIDPEQADSLTPDFDRVAVDDRRPADDLCCRVVGRDDKQHGKEEYYAAHGESRMVGKWYPNWTSTARLR